MAKAPKAVVVQKRIATNKRTSQGLGNLKMSSMNKKTRANFKQYRGQGR